MSFWEWFNFDKKSNKLNDIEVSVGVTVEVDVVEKSTESGTYMRTEDIPAWRERAGLPPLPSTETI